MIASGCASGEPTSRDLSVTEVLGAFIHDFELDSAPEEIRDLARLRVIDTIGAAFAGRASGIGALTLRNVTRNPGSGPSQYWFAPATGSAAEVAYANSILAHSVLMEDVGLGGHPAANVIPVALAVAQETGASGRQVLEAVITGYEIQTRIAAANSIYRVVGDRGLRGTTVTGCFGAAAAAAKLYGLSARECSHALAFAASLCATGIEQPVLEGSDERMLQMGQNTRSGVQAAMLARDGFCGARLALEGECGFYQAYMGIPMPPGVLEGLGSRWLSTTRNVFFKYYPTAGQNVGTVYTAEKLVNEGQITPANVGEIESITVLQKWWRANTAYTYAGPFATFEQALISDPLHISSVFLYGSYSLENVTKAMNDPAALELARRVTMDGVATWTILDSDVTVEMTDGTTIHRTSADMPRWMYAPGWDQCVEKFIRSAGDSADQAARDGLIAQVENLWERSSVAELARLLRLGGDVDAGTPE